MKHEYPQLNCKWAKRGDIITFEKSNQKYIVVSGENVNGDWIVHCRHLNESGLDDPYKELYGFNNTAHAVTVHEKYVQMRLSDNEPFIKKPQEDWVGENYPPEFSYAKHLSDDNPLRNLKFWNDPGGKNLTIIHCLQWAHLHLKMCNKELPCNENQKALGMIAGAIYQMKHRYTMRKKQGLLGTNTPHQSQKDEI